MILPGWHAADSHRTASTPMLETIRALILDAQESMPGDTGVARRLRIRQVPGKATVCVGVRRSGKSTCLMQVIRKLIDTAVARENILLVNF